MPALLLQGHPAMVELLLELGATATDLSAPPNKVCGSVCVCACECVCACMCVCVCVCVCVLCVSVCVRECMCVYAWKRSCVRARARTHVCLRETCCVARAAAVSHIPPLPPLSSLHPPFLPPLLTRPPPHTSLHPTQPKADYAALCHAAEKGSLPMVQLLLAKGASPYAFDDTGGPWAACVCRWACGCMACPLSSAAPHDLPAWRQLPPYPLAHQLCPAGCCTNCRLVGLAPGAAAAPCLPLALSHTHTHAHTPTSTPHTHTCTHAHTDARTHARTPPAGYCAYDYLVDQAKPLDLLRALLSADPTFAATQRNYQQAYQRLCAAVKRAQRYPALGCSCRTCNSVVEVRGCVRACVRVCMGGWGGGGGRGRMMGWRGGVVRALRLVVVLEGGGLH